MSATTTPPATPPETSGHGRDWTAEDLLGLMVADKLFGQQDFPRLLGPDRHQPSVGRVERALSRQNILGNERMLEYKMRVSGRRAADPASTPSPALPYDQARAHAAVALQSATGRPQVAFVHDTVPHIQSVARMMNVDPASIEVRITTLRTIERWLTRLKAPQSQLALVEARLPTIWKLLDTVIVDEGSDLHLTVGQPPLVRINGDLRPLPTEPVTQPWLVDQLRELYGRNLRDELDGHADINEAISFGRYRFRTVVANDQNGPTLVARLLSEHIPSMAALDLPAAVQNFATLERGFVAFTGPTGSGKSTSMAAIIQGILDHSPRKVITLEAPIEYEFSPGQGTVTQRELGRDFPTFSHAVSQALRQDPDIILVGEMRDAATVKAAVEAAETGHMVFSTLHTKDAASALQRIVDFFDAGEQVAIRAMLSYVLTGVVAQTLLPKESGGRVAAYEVLLGNTAIRNQLSTPEGMRQLRGTMQNSQSAGMCTMEQSLAKLVRAKQVSRANAEFKAQHRDQFASLLGG